MSIERGPYIMSDDFTGVGENSDDVDADTANRWGQRWQFVQYDVDVFTYDLVEQTEPLTAEYTSQTQTAHLSNEYTSQTQTAHSTFKYTSV